MEGKKQADINLPEEIKFLLDAQMAEIVDDALDAICQKYNLKAKTFFMETFGMMEEGKGNGGRASRYE